MFLQGLVFVLLKSSQKSVSYVGRKGAELAGVRADMVVEAVDDAIDRATEAVCEAVVETAAVMGKAALVAAAGAVTPEFTKEVARDFKENPVAFLQSPGTALMRVTRRSLIGW